MPAPPERLILTHLARRGQASYASSTDHRLFPGEILGRHLVTDNFRSNSSSTVFDPLMPARPRCSTSPARWPPRSWPTSWDAPLGRPAALDWTRYTAQRLPTDDE